MEKRLAIITESLNDLFFKLTHYLNDTFGANIIVTVGDKNYPSKNSSLLAKNIFDGEEGEEFIKLAIQNKKIHKLAQIWVTGAQVDWSHVYPQKNTQRISIPVYPFEKKRYWIPSTKKTVGVMDQETDAVSKLHPLVHKNTSTFREEQFKSNFSGHEFFLSDHIVGKMKVFPGVA